MKKLYFVILHYLVYEETIKCVQSILNSQRDTSFHIVVVDNGSPNGSGEIILAEFRDSENVTVLFNKHNLGFARGNNVGFQYAKEQGAEFIYMINNDTIINQENCLAILEKAFDEHHFHLLGPDIILTKNHQHQNPAVPTIQDAEVLKNMIFQHRMLYLLSFLNVDISLPRLKKKLFNQPPQRQKTVNIDHEKVQTGVKIHGSAMVFSKLYIKNYDGLYPHTFMYSEEAILYYIARRDNLTTIYYPELKILHSEDKATEELVGTNAKKRRFYYKNYIKSGQELQKLMIKDRYESV